MLSRQLGVLTSHSHNPACTLTSAELPPPPRSSLAWLLHVGARNRVVASVTPAPGLALLHLHGEDRCLEHEAAEVRQGVKYVLRSDVVFAPP